MTSDNQETDKLLAVNEVKESLLELEEAFFESLNPTELRLWQQLSLPLVTERLPYDSNEYSPTPGDPYNLSAYGEEGHYFFAAGKLMIGKLSSQSKIAGINDFDRYSIEGEIMNQHRMQSDQNNSSMERLRRAFITNRASFNPGMGDLIERVRSGDATSEERIVLLMAHPEMDSIEDMKFTSPLDIKACKRAMNFYRHDLKELDHNTVIDVTEFPENQQESRLVEVTDNVDNRIVIFKSVIAELTSPQSNTILEIVERRSFFVFPTNPQLRGVSENYVARNGKKANLQPIAVSAYLRVKRNNLTSNNDDTQEISDESDSEKIAIFSNGSRTALESLSKTNDLPDFRLDIAD